MNEVTEDRVKIIAQEVMNDKVVYHDICREKHKGVDKLEKRVEMMDRKLWGILVILVALAIKTFI